MDGSLQLERWTDGVLNVLPITSNQSSSEVLHSGQTYELTVRHASGFLLILLDGQELGRSVDKSFTRGWIGMFTESQAGGEAFNVRFDNLVVYKLQVTETP